MHRLLNYISPIEILILPCQSYIYRWEVMNMMESSPTLISNLLIDVWRGDQIFTISNRNLHYFPESSGSYPNNWFYCRAYLSHIYQLPHLYWLYRTKIHPTMRSVNLHWILWSDQCRRTNPSSYLFHSTSSPLKSCGAATHHFSAYEATLSSQASIKKCHIRDKEVGIMNLPKYKSMEFWMHRSFVYRILLSFRVEEVVEERRGA